MPDSNEDGFVLLDETEVQDYNDAGILPQSPEVIQAVLDWLQPTAYDDGTSEYARHLASHLRGTGDWLADTDEYRHWHDGGDNQSHLLWIKAAPGTGKSVIAAHQRSHLASSEHAIVLHFFFRYIITSNRTPMQLVRDWTAQLLPFSPALQMRMKENFLDKRKSLSMTKFETLWEEFRSACRTLSRLYCFVDALDEMSLGHDDFFHHLLQLRDVPACKVFVTSRPIPRIVEIFRKTSAIRITLGPDNISDDISTYVDHRIEKDMARYIDHRLDRHAADLGDHEVRLAVGPLIRCTLQDKAQGSFLYSKLMLDNVLEAVRRMDGGVSVDKLRPVLDRLPTGLGAMYGDMLRSHAYRTNTPPELQQNILCWITHSERPLRLLELATILKSVNSGSGGTIPVDAKALIRTACGPLLEIMPSDVVGPVHHSFTEYLTSAATAEGRRNAGFIDSKLAHRYILELCLNYLIQLDLPEVAPQPNEDASPLDIRGEHNDLKLKYPFFEYAMLYWPCHARKCGRLDPSILQLLDRFFKEPRKASRLWIQSAVPAHSKYYFDASRVLSGPLWSNTVASLHVAAVVGLHDYAAHLLSSGYEVDVPTKFGWTPLLYAALNGNASTLAILLQGGANPYQTVDGGRRNPLGIASEAGYADCVDCLMMSAAAWSRRGSLNRIAAAKKSPRSLEEGYNGGAQNTGNAGPSTVMNMQLVAAISSAIVQCQNKVIDAFLKYLNSEEIGEIFQQSMAQQKTEIGLAVIDEPNFNVDALINGQSPIAIAVASVDVDCICALLQRNARLVSDPKQVGNDGNLLHLLITHVKRRCSSNIKELGKVIEMLVGTGIAVDATDSHGHTALYRVRSNHTLAATLLNLGASADTASGGGSSPLHDIAGDSEEGMKFWIHYGFDINSRDATGETPLHAALQGRHNHADAVKSVHTLLTLGADPNMYSLAGLTPLHMCHVGSHANKKAQLFKLLLKAGADPNARDLNGNTPLMTLESGPSEEAGSAREILLAAGADPAARNVLGETAFLATIRRQHHRLRQAEIYCDIVSDVHMISSNGHNAALTFCRNPTNIARMRELADAGVNFKLVDRFGNTAVHNMALVERPSGQRGKEIDDDEFLRMLYHLLHMGIDPDRKNLWGQTPLHFAIISNEPVMVGWLLRTPAQQAKIDEADVRGLTPLHVAACMSSARVFSLIEYGADPLSLTKTGQSALHLAAVAQNGNVIALLFACTNARQKAFINLADDSGMTPLHYAARSGRHDIVKLLLDAGADPNVRDARQRAPLNSCAEFDNEQELWAYARKNVQDLQGSFIRSRSSNYTMQRLDANIFDWAPVAMTKSWEAMARELSVAKAERQYSHYPQKPSIRQTVKYLLSSGAEVVLPERATSHLNPRQSFGEMEWDPRSAVLQALGNSNTCCNSLLSELLSFLEAREGGLQQLYTALELGVEFGVGHPQIRADRAKDSYLRELAQSQESIENLRYAFDFLMEQDRSDLAAALLIASKRGEEFDSWSSGYYFDQLICEGHSDAVASCVKVLEQPGIQTAEIDNRLWPASLQNLPLKRPSFGCVKGRSKVELPPGFVYDHELLKGQANGALLEACKRKDPNHEMVMVLMKYGSCSQREMSFALATIATCPEPWHLQIIEHLIQNGGDIDAQDPYGRTSLMRACYEAGAGRSLKREVVKLLLKLGASVDILDAEQRSCLDFALSAVGLEKVDFLVPSNETIRVLLEHGASVKEMAGYRVLLHAIKWHNPDLIRLLMDHGVDLRRAEIEMKRLAEVKKQVGGDSSRSLADHDSFNDVSSKKTVENSTTTLTSLLGKAFPQRTPSLRRLPRLYETVQVLLDGGADPFCPLDDGTPFLHYLLMEGWDSRMILAKPGLYLEKRDQKGRTPWLAAGRGPGNSDDFWSTGSCCAENVQYLLERGVDILATDNDGNNALHHYATIPGASDIIRRVLEKDGMIGLVDSRNKEGKRPVQLALRHGSWETARQLMEHGADITIVGPDGLTPAHRLLPVSTISNSTLGDVEPVRRLIEKLVSYIEMGAGWEKQARLTPLMEGETRSIDVNALNKDGEPALFRLLRLPLHTGVDLRNILFSGDTSADVNDHDAETEGAEDKDEFERTVHEIGELWRRAGLRLDVKSRDGGGALHAFAARQRNNHFYNRRSEIDDLIKDRWIKLVRTGLDPYAEDNNQRSALDIASACGNLEILELY